MRIRPIQIGDADAIFELKSDPAVTARYGQEPHTSLDQSRDWIRNRLVDYTKHNAIFWVFVLKEAQNDRLIGACCYWNFEPSFRCVEIGYELHQSYWNKGIMSEALPPIIEYGFTQMDLHRIEGLPLAVNEPSRKLLTKMGFRLEGTFRERVFFHNKFEDQMIYGLLKEEWLPRTIGAK